MSAELLLAALPQPPVRPAAARRVARRALRVVCEAPLGNGFTAAEVAATRPVLAAGLEAVADYLAGRRGWPTGDRLWDSVVRAADLVGPCHPPPIGPAAAAWAVVWLVAAADELADGSADPDRAGAAADHAAEAAWLAVRAGDAGPTPEAVRFLAATFTGDDPTS